MTPPDRGAGDAPTDDLGSPDGLTHLSASGDARMVDVSEKEVTARSATAEAVVRMAADTFRRLMEGETPKGDVLATARIAGIMAAKKTSELIPLCHPLPITKVAVTLTPDERLPGVHVEATVACQGKTGVEMEALTAASVAALTIYDMLKAVDKAMVVERIALLAKSGGRSGNFQRAPGSP